MIPDKICVAPHQIYYHDLDIQEVGHNGAEEYIRKDIVDETVEVAEDHAYFAGKEKLREEFLEWVREREDEITKKMDGYNIPPKEYQGELNAYRNVIEKMKSL